MRAMRGEYEHKMTRKLPRCADLQPSTNPKAAENCTPSSGDTAWMLASVGLGLFHRRMMRKKNDGG
jgi:hypothetical protein